MKKIVAAFLTLVMILGLAACGGSGEAPATEPGSAAAPATAAPVEDKPGAVGTETVDEDLTYANKNLVVGNPSDPRYWDPWGDFNTGRQHTIPIVYQTLASYYPDLEKGELNEYLVMLTGYEEIEPGVYKITLREGITDTENNPFTSEDAVFSFETARGKGIWWELNAVDGFEIVDDVNFIMYTNENLATGDFQNILTNFPMVTKEAFESSADGMITTPVGTSGYKLAEYVAGSHVLFEKVDNYWNAAANESKSSEDGYCPWYDNTKADTIRFEIITDKSAMVVALESGQIDIASGISFANSQIFRSGANAENFNISYRPDNMFALSFNASEGSPTNNYNLRMAIALCVDSQGVLNAALDGSGTVLKGWAYNTYNDWQDSWDTDPYFEYNMEQAKEYLEKFYEETGTTADTLKLRLLNQNGGSASKIGQAIQAYIIELVGNPECVELLEFDRSVYESMWEQADAFDLLLMYAQTVSRITCAYTWSRQADTRKTESGNDLWHSGDDECQRLLEQAIGVDTHSDETVAAFQAYINEQAYIKNLLAENVYVISAKWIDGTQNGFGYKGALPVLAFNYHWSESGK